MNYSRGDMESEVKIFQSLPLELQSHILISVGNPKTSLVSKDWYKATKAAFQNLITSYEKSPILKEYVQQAKGQEIGVDHDANRVKEVYQSLIQKATLFEIKKPTDLTLSEFERTAFEVKEQENLQLISFFEQATAELPLVKEFLILIKGLSTADQALQIREWMRKNRALLETVLALDLGGRDIKSLPEEISFFSNLRAINLSDNSLKFLPDSLGNLQKLETIGLDNNQLETLPDSFDNLQSLYAVDIRGNLFNSIPEPLERLKELNPNVDILM